MKKLSLLLIVLLSLGLMIAGCGDEDDPAEPTGTVASLLSVVAHESSVDLTWNGDSGTAYTFEVYMSEGNQNNFALIETTYGNGRIVPKAGEALTLDNDQEYYFRVDTIDEDGTVAGSTNTIRTSPRVEFTGTVGQLWEFADDNHFSAFHMDDVLSEIGALSMQYQDKYEIDFYLGTGVTQNGDPVNDDLALKSPHLVDSPNDWSDRITWMAAYNGSFDDPDATLFPNSSQSYAVSALQQGLVIHFRIVKENPNPMIPAEDHYAKIEILSIAQDGDYRTITFKGAYQEVAGLPYF